MKTINPLTSILLVFVLIAAQVGNAFAGASLFFLGATQAHCAIGSAMGFEASDPDTMLSMHDAMNTQTDTQLETNTPADTPKTDTTMDCCDVPDTTRATTSCCGGECQCMAFASTLVFLDVNTTITLAPINDAPHVEYTLGAAPAHNKQPKRPPITTFL